ncbi:MAG TPA: SPFH domain-containing protein [Polyangiaceae bacterium]|nr:SPFH domain-containing protein [Polyangiaceae bacterium]
MATKKISFDPEASGGRLRQIAIAIALLVGLGFLLDATLMRIDAGHVGIKVKLAGSARGVQDIPVVTGWVMYNPLTEQIVSFPISVQNVVWTSSTNEGRAVDESITFSSQEGVNVNSDVGLSFHIDSAKAPHLYLRFRQPDVLVLADGYVRNAVREAFNDIASRMAVQDIYGAGKGKLVADVTARLRDVLGGDGFIIDQLTINGALRLPENVAQAINRAMEATQNAIQAENRVRQVRAEAEQAIAQAHGGAEAARQRAEGEADAILIRARADAKSNEIIRLSTTGTVLQYRAIERWDGKLPMMQSGDKLPLLTFDTSKLALNDAEREKKLAELLAEDKSENKAVPPPGDDTSSSASSSARPAPASSAAPASPAAPAEPAKQ